MLRKSSQDPGLSFKSPKQLAAAETQTSAPIAAARNSGRTSREHSKEHTPIRRKNTQWTPREETQHEMNQGCFDGLFNSIAGGGPASNYNFYNSYGTVPITADLRRTTSMLLSTNDSGDDDTDTQISDVSFSVASLRTGTPMKQLPKTVRQKTRSAEGDQKISAENVGQITRLIAPNVLKLPVGSVIEIHIQGEDEVVAVLCSRDVLKMRSAFFFDKIEDKQKTISLCDAAPFECATFLESLHDGRNLTADAKWSFNWSRLSVLWKIDDVMTDFAAIIDKHIASVLCRVENNCWRTNSDVLSGFRCALFRRTSANLPTVLVGTILDGVSTTTTSSLRVAFDHSSTPSSKPKISFSGFSRSPFRLAQSNVDAEQRLDQQVPADWEEFGITTTASCGDTVESVCFEQESVNIEIKEKDPIWYVTFYANVLEFTKLLKAHKYTI